MTPLTTAPDAPNPDLSATTTLPRYAGPEPPTAASPAPPPLLSPSAAEPGPTREPAPAERSLAAPSADTPIGSAPPTPEPSLLAPDSLFYKRSDATPQPTAPLPSPESEPNLLAVDPRASVADAPPAPSEARTATPEPSLLAPDSLFHTSADRAPSADTAPPAASEAGPTTPETSLLAPDSLFHKRSDTPPRPTAPLPSPESEPNLLVPNRLFPEEADSAPSTDSAPTSAPQPSLLSPTSLYYAPADRTPPADTPPAAKPLLAPTSLYYATANRSPGTSPEPLVAASDASNQELVEPPAQSPTIRRAPEPVLVTSAPHDPTAADRRARLVLHHASEPGDSLLCRLVTRFGAPTVASALLSGSAADLLSPQDEESARDRAALISRAHTLQTRCYRADPDADLAVGEKSGARYVIPADPEWPAALDDLGDTAPLGMWFLGKADLVAATKRAVSIVGARIATGYGMHVAGELAAGLAERGWAVISGAARGIDGAAHRGALAARGVTVAALACGIDLVYPAGHEALIGAIASDGLVVSELPPGTMVSRFRFLDRNRVIAALGLGTLVVEAAARSGSLVTARLADELGRPVLAVPGPVTSEASEGTHQLIRDGALLVTRAAEVVEHLGDFGADLAEPTVTARTSSRRPRDSLDPIAARVLDALPIAGRGTLDTVEAALAAGLEPRAVHAALGRLAAAGWVDRDERGWCARLVP